MCTNYVGSKGHYRRVISIPKQGRKIGSVIDSFFHNVPSLDPVWGHFYADRIKLLMHPSVWEHDRGGCNKLQGGNCGRPGCLPQWTRDWGTKLKDRIIEKIRIEIGGCLLQKELGQQTQPLSHLSEITPLLPSSCLNIYRSWNNSICSKCILHSYTAESHSTPFSQELDFDLLNLLQGLFKTFLWLCVGNCSEIIRPCWFLLEIMARNSQVRPR